jgi:hypothetical protein
MSDTCGFLAVGRLQLLLVLARAVTAKPKSLRTPDYILLPHLRLPQLGDQVPVFISVRITVSQLYPGHWVILVPEVEDKLRPTVSRPVYLGVGLPSAAHDNCVFLDVVHPL